jgi:hypothetical protein
LETLRSLLKQRKGRSVRVTQRTVIVEALTFLEQHLKNPLPVRKGSSENRKGISDSGEN